MVLLIILLMIFMIIQIQISDFIWEVWYIVSQLTEYNSDQDYYVGDEGRYALDTLARGGGDCEDLVILIADMLMSSETYKGLDVRIYLQ